MLHDPPRAWPPPRTRGSTAAAVYVAVVCDRHPRTDSARLQNTALKLFSAAQPAALPGRCRDGVSER
ncbi:MAG TPA: hypothetical protein DCM50_03875 [Stenotrophomonas sp.]|nr:hypothetical protein [Stenotrophomonas sp.]